jgi:hypothetical protein
LFQGLKGRFVSPFSQHALFHLKIRLPTLRGTLPSIS